MKNQIILFCALAVVQVAISSEKTWLAHFVANADDISSGTVSQTKTISPSLGFPTIGDLRRYTFENRILPNIGKRDVIITATPLGQNLDCEIPLNAIKSSDLWVYPKALYIEYADPSIIAKGTYKMFKLGQPVTSAQQNITPQEAYMSSDTVAVSVGGNNVYGKIVGVKNDNNYDIDIGCRTTEVRPEDIIGKIP